MSIRTTQASHAGRVWRMTVPACAPLLILATLCGCSGGSGGSNPGLVPAGKSTVSGTVSDAGGAPIVNAAVRIGTLSTTSTQEGDYVIQAVPVPSGQNSVTTTVSATAVVNGQTWTGQNQLEVLNGQANTSNVHVVLSNPASQGRISGTVRDANNTPIFGARVFAGIGPYTSDPANPASLFFSNLSSFNTSTDRSGNFTLPMLPAATNYTVVASFASPSASLVNQTVHNVSVTAANTTTLSFVLNAPGGGSTVPAVTGFSGISFTVPASATRGAGASVQALNAIRQQILRAKGLLTHRAAASASIALHHGTTRSTPAGFEIESDLFWDYDANLSNLYGYDILRATTLNPAANFASIALLRDPLADRFSDVDPTLTPDTITYYDLARLDTVNFPVNGDEGPTVQPPVAVEPLGPETQVSPVGGAQTAPTPTFRWNAVNRAAAYQVNVFDRFPTLQSDTDPNGVPPIWPADPTSPGASFVTAPATQPATYNLTYGGPTLVHGHTYYWAVIAQDASGSAFSISALQSFIVP